MDPFLENFFLFFISIFKDLKNSKKEKEKKNSKLNDPSSKQDEYIQKIKELQRSLVEQELVIKDLNQRSLEQIEKINVTQF